MEGSEFLRSLFGLRKELSLGFYIADFIFRKILRQNADTTWAVHHTATIHSPAKITRGKNVFPGDSPGVYINALNGLKVGDYSNIGPNVGLVSANHDFVNNDAHTATRPIVIGRFCWLGMGSVVLPAVELGDFTIVGAGAVVTKSFPEGYAVIAGNPAKLIRHLDKDLCNFYAKSRT